MQLYTTDTYENHYQTLYDVIACIIDIIEIVVSLLTLSISTIGSIGFNSNRQQSLTICDIDTVDNTVSRIGINTD